MYIYIIFIDIQSQRYQSVYLGDPIVSQGWLRRDPASASST